jgi:hypothetical protein
MAKQFQCPFEKLFQVGTNSLDGITHSYSGSGSKDSVVVNNDSNDNDNDNGQAKIDGECTIYDVRVLISRYLELKNDMEKDTKYIEMSIEEKMSDLEVSVWSVCISYISSLTLCVCVCGVA